MNRNAAIPITDEMKQVILGTILGDGTLEPPPSGSVNWGLSWKHSGKQEIYARWKAARLSSLISKIDMIPPGPEPRLICGKSAKDNGRIRVRTIRHPYFTALAKEFIREGRKTVPNDLELGPLALSVWHMDDGSLSWIRKGKRALIRLSSFCFTAEENFRLRKILTEKFGLETKPFFSTGKKFEGIALHGENAEKFLNIVTPFLQGTGLEYKGKKRA